MAETRRRFWICLGILVPAAFVLRLGLALRVPNIHRTDEVFQTLEPAHRLWSGWGVITWEWRDGIRSWLFPDFLAGLMRLSYQSGFGADAYLPFIAAVLSAVSLGVVVMGIVLGWRHSGLAGAVLCGILCSVWPDLVYFAPKTLNEIQAGNVLLVAAGLASMPPPMAEWRRLCRIFAIGLLLGVVFCLRFQLAPAMLLVLLWTGWKGGVRGWLPLLCGAAIPLLALGVSDDLAWGSPFQSVWKNFHMNFVEKRSQAYGVSPPWWFLSEEATSWGAALLPVLLFFCAGAGAAPLLALLAIVVVLSHSIIAHKEISFIYAAVPPAIIVAGLGTARLVLILPRLLKPAVAPRALLAAAASLWLGVALLADMAALKSQWHGVNDSLLILTKEAGKHPDLCGLGFYGPDFPWNSTGGYSFLNRPVPIYLLRTRASLAKAQSGVNYLLANAVLEADLPEYRRVRCAGGYCLMHHEQACTEVPAFRINAVLQQEGH